MKTIGYTIAARRQFRRLPLRAREQISAKLRRYAETGAGDVTMLKGQPGARLRAGDYRAIFVEKEDAIEARAVGHRRDIYT